MWKTKRNIQKTRFETIRVGKRTHLQGSLRVAMVMRTIALISNQKVCDPAKLVLDSFFFGSVICPVSQHLPYTIFPIVHQSDSQEVILITIASKLSGHLSLLSAIWCLSCPIIGPLE